MFFTLDVNKLPSVRFIGRIIYSDPWIHFNRVSEEYILYIIKKGELYLQEEDCKYALKQGDMLLLEPGKAHFGYEKSLCDYYYVHFRHPGLCPAPDKSGDSLLQEMIDKRKLALTSYSLSETLPSDSVSHIPKYWHTDNDSEYMLILKEAVSEYQRKYEFYKEQVSIRFLDFLIRVGREYVSTKAESTQEHLSKAFVKTQTLLNFLNREYRKKITSADIEETFESNYDYLNRIFHKNTGFTIFDYLNLVRINKAKEIMETTSLKFSEIGYLIGIDNPYYFSKLFKKYSGMTSTQYWQMINRKIE